MLCLIILHIATWPALSTAFRFKAGRVRMLCLCFVWLVQKKVLKLHARPDIRPAANLTTPGIGVGFFSVCTLREFAESTTPYEDARTLYYNARTFAGKSRAKLSVTLRAIALSRNAASMALHGAARQPICVSKTCAETGVLA